MGAITELQKSIIEKLANESDSYADAMIAFGRDMFQKGRKEGMIIGGAIAVAGLAASGVVYVANVVQVNTFKKALKDEYGIDLDKKKEKEVKEEEPT